MLKSMQWTLQLWHAGLLAAVLVAFGVASYFGISRTRYAEVDAELERSVQALAAGCRPVRPHWPLGPVGKFMAIFGWWLFDEHSRAEPPPPDRSPLMPADTGPPGPPHFTEDGPADRPHRDERMHFPRPEFRLAPALAQQMGDGKAGATYYVAWDFDGKIVQTSVPAWNVPYPGQRPQMLFPPPTPELPRFRQRGDLRESFVNGPMGTRLLVGRSVRREQIEMQRLAWLLSITGAGVLAVGLVGGWMVSVRAVRPIRTITTVAQEISASNLSRRIDTAGTKSELGQLAAVLNDTFARLEAAFQQQVRFTADASHELRTPLTVIHTQAQLAISRARSAEEYHGMFETCLRASGRMKQLVDSLLLLAGADAGRLLLERSSFDLRDVVNECVKMVAPLATRKNLLVETHLQSAELAADASRVAQVVMNLLTNAIRYNREGGRLDVTVSTGGADAVLTIADTGVGIPAESQPHLFERFYRVDKARSREDGGSGLGLAICKSIVEAHNGTITFHSEVGQGTTFIVRLPLTAPDDCHPPVPG